MSACCCPVSCCGTVSPVYSCCPIHNENPTACVYINCINSDYKREISHVKCLICNHEWVAIRPEGTTELECPNCNNIYYFENTGKT